MATITFNPYPQIGEQLTKGLDDIVSGLDAASTVDDLVNAVYKYIQPIYYPDSGLGVPKQIEVEIKSVAYNIINCYNNKALGNTLTYDQQQANIIDMMIGSRTTDHTPINALDSWFLDIEDNISKADLSIDAQTPLLLTTECAKSIYVYWTGKIATPAKWAPFFQTPAALNYANIPFWIEACMEGTLIGANASQKGLIAPTTEIVSVNIVSALIGALTIGAGKVIFKWVPRIQPKQLTSKLTLNKEIISLLNDQTIGSGGDGGGTQLWGTQAMCFASRAKDCSRASCARTTGVLVCIPL